MNNYHPLPDTLLFSVPMWQEEIRKDYDYYWNKREFYAQFIGEKGDIILYRGNKKGETAEAFNTLSCAIALLSFQPGGIKIFGHHFIGKNN